LSRHSRIAQGKYLYSLCVRELGKRASLAQIRATLLGLVSIIVGSCAKKKVVRIDAWRVVAPVEDAQFFWDWTFIQNPRRAMCSHQLPSGKQYSSVAVKGFARRPFPTARFDNYIATFKSWFQAPVHDENLFYVGGKVQKKICRL
jgi:hypothetical protein